MFYPVFMTLPLPFILLTAYLVSFLFLNSGKSEVVLLTKTFFGPCSPVSYYWL